MSDKIFSIDDVINKHIPIQILYNGNSIIVYISKINDILYIKTNLNKNISFSKWKEIKDGKDIVNFVNKKYNNNLPIFSSTIKGTWVSVHEFVKSYFNWIGKKDSIYDGFGTYLADNIETLYHKYSEENDIYFMKIDKRFIRANRETHFINLTDMLILFGRMMKNFVKNNGISKYIQDNPCHYIESKDEFNVKTTYGYPNLALLLLNWLYYDTVKGRDEIYLKIETFINIHKNDLE